MCRLDALHDLRSMAIFHFYMCRLNTLTPPISLVPSPSFFVRREVHGTLWAEKKKEGPGTVICRELANHDKKAKSDTVHVQHLKDQRKGSLFTFLEDAITLQTAVYIFTGYFRHD